MPRRPSRRQFLKTSAVVSSGYFVAWGATSRAAERSANERIRVASIGVGGKGGSDTDQAGEFGDIVALCDVDEGTLAAKAKKFPQARTFTDFRRLFDELGDSFDAVTVSTPDHTHAPAAVRAMKLGKHVYCQKPLTHSVYEARVMRETAARMNVATQMGNQGTAESGLREAVEVIRSGAIGPVRQVHVWTNRPVWPQAPDVMARPSFTDEIPAGLNWDEFLGPAPYRPFAAAYREDGVRNKIKGKRVYHPFTWRGWWDFGTGALGDMGCHTANMAFMALELGHPTRIEAEAGDLNAETAPSVATVRYEFPARGEQPPVKVYWYEGQFLGADGQLKKNLPPAELLHGKTPPGSGLLLVGDKGTLYSPNDYGAQYVLLPEQDFKGFQPPKPTLPRHDDGNRDRAMKAEWFAAMKGGPKPLSNFDYAGLLTEFILLGNVAIRTGKPLEWDGAAGQVTNCPEAAQFVRREYRAGWEL